MSDSNGASSPEVVRSLEFGGFILLPERHLLLKGEETVRVGSRALSLLTKLLEHPGETVSKSDLLNAGWPSLHVEEHNLKTNIGILRRILGDSGQAGQFITTVSGRGYRFVAAVQHRLSRVPNPDAGGKPARYSNLPHQSQSVFGRSRTIAAICSDFDQSRLVTIVGTGGVGKTTVSIHVAEKLLPKFRDGVVFVDLDATNDPRHVANAIAQSAGIAAQSANRLAALCAHLRAGETLIILDNCEHVLDEVAHTVTRILADAPLVKILATSREPLSLPAEKIRRLKGLDTPPIAKGLTATEALAFPAIQLFVDRARQRCPDFALSDAQAMTAAEVCRRLDGLALAIELAATQVPALGMEELLRQLDSRILSAEEEHAKFGRHRTLFATLEWSYGLLSDDEKMVLCRLSAFAGAFSMDSACAVAADTTRSRAAVFDGVARLVSKSLISVEPDRREPHYFLLNTTRAFAGEKLAALEDPDRTRWLHAHHVHAMAQMAAADTKTSTLDGWLEKYGSLIDDIRLALQWTFSRPGDAALGVKLTVAAVPFWRHLSLLEEGRTAAEGALHEAFAQYRDQSDELALNLAVGAMGLHARGPLPYVKTALTRALESAERLGHTEMQLQCLRAISEYYLWTSDTRGAMEASERIRQINTVRIAAADDAADVQTGTALRWIGELQRSQHYLENVIRRPVARHRSETADFEFNQRLVALGSLAQVSWLQGFPDRAIQLAEQQLDGARNSNYSVALCSALVQSTAIALFIGDLDAADQHLTLLDEHAAEHGLPVWRSMARCHRGRLLYDAGEPVDLELFRQSLSELHDAGFRMRYPAYLAHFSLGQSQHGDFEGALASINEVIDRCRANGHSWGIPEALRLKATYILGLGGRDAEELSAGLLTQSIEMARHQGARSWELRSLITQAQFSKTESLSAALRELSAASGKFTEGLHTIDLVRARQILAGTGSSPSDLQLRSGGRISRQAN
ncbi:ATP-binding protein [Rhizobium lentis]|nr:winged helix-turn-helix domain-containing protein [Rhizobium lentis]